MGHLCHVTKTIWTNFCSPSKGVSIWKLSSIGPVVSEEKVFENVDGRTPGVIGILIAHLGAFGSGELKNMKEKASYITITVMTLKLKTNFSSIMRKVHNETPCLLYHKSGKI